MPPKLFPKSLVPSIIGLFIISCVVQAHAGYDSGTEPGLCPGGDLSIEQIVPEEGTVGTMVAVRGHGFADEVNVWLGDMDLGIQASISPELIVIEVPEIAVDGSTDEADCGFSVMNLVVKNLPTLNRISALWGPGSRSTVTTSFRIRSFSSGGCPHGLSSSYLKTNCAWKHLNCHVSWL